jgi:hypothetical protein
MMIYRSSGDRRSRALVYVQGSMRKAFIDPQGSLPFDQAPQRLHQRSENSGLPPMQELTMHAALGTNLHGQSFPHRAAVQASESPDQWTAPLNRRSTSFRADGGMRDLYSKSFNLSFAEYRQDHYTGTLFQ